ncbi:MAG TPA: adenylate/guanylate cyclase domain-containing protein [Candidatus Limnocylindria bacterium]|nr:adenylate/guanylate cyclase domain-containing protein [Candidatus Limnocylindria bacterium]
MARDLPSGTVTFLFTDVEGSTKLLHALGPEAYADALATHRRMLRDAFTRHGGVEVDTQGDAFFVAFPTAPGGLAAAREATDALAAGPIKVRIGLHTGTPHLGPEGYIGADVHKGARIAAAGHGGQILVSAATAALLDEQLRDLGEHRLKDLAAPERIYQADPDEHPPLKTLHQTNLPVPATAFLGREAELGEIGALLARDDVRVVTLTGPGGTGKTRLALQAAANASDAFPDGVWWVPLASLRDPALVLESAGRALSAAGDLSDHIGDKRMLVVFDNFEHVTTAADGLASLLAACAKLAVLVTSREPLHLDGELVYAVDPLDPDEAVELFLTRAMAAKRDFTPSPEVAQICERLDRLPLAIELAAARVTILSPAALLDRLEQRLPLLTASTRGAPDRQRTLRATIEWSHELLADGEQRLFRRLAAFRGGSTLAAAEAVADADLDTLQSLVEKSLVRVRAHDRFWMLETIREFAVERLEASGEADELRDRHAQFYLAMAERLEPRVRGDPREALDELERDLDNLRAAHDRLSRTGPELDEVRLIAALWRLWMQRGHLAEGDRRVASVRAGAAKGTSARAHALNGVTVIGMARGRPEVAAAEEALSLHRELGDRSGVAYSTFLMGALAAEVSDWETGRRRFLESLEAFRELDDPYYSLLATRNVAWMEYELGNRAEAESLHQEVIRRARADGNRRMEASSLGALAEYAILDGRPADGLDRLRRSTIMHRENGEMIEVTINLRRYARALAELGDVEAALRIIGAADAADDEMGAARASWVRDLDDGTLAIAARDMRQEQVEAARRDGRATGLDEAVEALLDNARPTE